MDTRVAIVGVILAASTPLLAQSPQLDYSLADSQTFILPIARAATAARQRRDTLT
jgi:hypothetical protein